MEEDMEEIQQMDLNPFTTSIRRTLTMKNNAARQVVNFMPSRHPYHTIRLRHTGSEHNVLLAQAADSQGDPATTQADIIVREMEQHSQLMDDSPASELLRREALRDLAQGLPMKRHVRAKLSASVSLRSKRRPLPLWKRMKYRLSFAVKRSRDRLRDLIFSIELWYESIRKIEGHFGSAVGSYFYFLRFLFVTNVCLAAVTTALVVTPQLLRENNGTVIDRGWSLMDFISGKGSYAVLFYGQYAAGDISAGALPYNMTFAYFFTMLVAYFAVFALLCYRTAYSYRHNFIETSGARHVFANKVFCGWDFGVINPRAALLNATSIYNEFKELLNEREKNQTESSLCTKLGQYMTNIIMSTIVVGLIVGLQWGFWELLRVSPQTAYWEVLVSLTLVSAVALLPVLFTLVVRLEHYKPRTALYVTLARTWLLHMSALLLLFYYWTQSAADCWETSFGQEMYRLVLLDCLISLFLLPLFEVIRGVLFKVYKLGSPPEFNIAYNSLVLIYNQAVLWFGLLFCPVLALCVTIKLPLLFYAKQITALKACQPAGKIWRASQTQTVLFMLVTLSLFTTLFALGSLFFKMPSQKCGPFTQYEFVYQVLSEGLLRLSYYRTLSNIIAFITRPGVIAFLLLFLCVAVYYTRAKARAQHSSARLLRHMLLLQAKDKDFLLTAIAKVSSGEWLYSPKPEDEGPSSYTWKYLNEVRKPSNAGFHFDARRLSQSRPLSYVRETSRNSQMERPHSDGETDSSFSWQGSSSCLNQKDLEKKWT